MTLAHIFQKLRQTRKENASLSELIMDGLYSSRQISPLKHDDWISCSKVPTMCPRAYFFAALLKLPLVDDRDPQLRWRADRGTALHSMFQELWLAPLGYILGGWRCPHCFHLHGANKEGKVLMSTAVACPERCEMCGKEWREREPFRYVEAWAINNELKVRGRMDAILKLPGYYPEVDDLKTTHFLGTGSSPWSIIHNPREKDVKQLHWYMDAAQVRRGRIIYLDPGAENVEEAMVEHKVSFNPTLMHREKEKVRALRKALKEAEEEGAGPGPDCPYDQKLYGVDCPCVEMESFRTGTGD